MESWLLNPTHYWVLKGSRALPIRSLEAWGKILRGSAVLGLCISDGSGLKVQGCPESDTPETSDFSEFAGGS